MLTKPQEVTYIPSKPQVEGHDAYTVCTNTGGTSPGGHWESVCGYDPMPVMVVSGPTPGVYPPDPGPFPYTLYVPVYTCKSVWVPD